MSNSVTVDHDRLLKNETELSFTDGASVEGVDGAVDAGVAAEGVNLCAADDSGGGEASGGGGD